VWIVAAAVIVVMAASAPAASGAQRYTEPGGDGPAATCPQADPCSFPVAVNSANTDDGDEVIVLPGDYMLSGGVTSGDDIDVHGVAGQPRPRLFLAGGVNGLTVFDGGSPQLPRYTDLELYSSGAVIAAVNAFAGDFTRTVVHATGGADRACSNGKGSFRDAVCFNSGGTLALGCQCQGGGFDGTVTLRNVTAVASGAGSRGILLQAGLNAKLRIEGKNVIASGEAEDVRAESDSSAGVIASIALDYSNFDSASTNAGTGTSATAPGTSFNQTTPPIFADAANANFDQAPSSPTIDAGIDDGLLGSTDLDGDPRLLGSAPDIGEDESVSANPAEPSNAFRFGKLKRNKRKGIAFLFVILPGPGEVGLRGKGLKTIGGAGVARASRAVAGGTVKLKVEPAKKGKRARKIRRALLSEGKAKVKALVTYLPTGGTVNTQARKLKLKKKL
jgi:hypothetical protein